MSDEDRERLDRDVNALGGDVKSTLFVRGLFSKGLASHNLFAVAQAATPSPYMVAMYSFEHPVNGVAAVPFRMIAGRWVSTAVRDATLKDRFIEFCQVPYLLWKSELLSMKATGVGK
jgi:hypothetical protein